MVKERQLEVTWFPQELFSCFDGRFYLAIRLAVARANRTVLQFPGIWEERKPSGGKVRTIDANYGVRAPISAEVIFQLGDHGSRTSASQLVDLPIWEERKLPGGKLRTIDAKYSVRAPISSLLGVVVHGDEKFSAFVWEQVGRDAFPGSLRYFRALQAFP